MGEEGQRAEGERVKAKVGKQSWTLKAKGIAKRTSLHFEHELHEPISLLPPKFKVPYFEEVKLEVAPVLSIAEVKLKEPKEGKEAEMAVLNRIWEKLKEGGMIQSALGFAADGFGLDLNKWTLGTPGESSGWSPEFKKSTNKPLSFEINIHDTWSFPDAKPVPVELQVAAIACAYDQENKEWEYGAIQGEGTLEGLSLPDWHEGEEFVVEGIKLEGKLTLTAMPDYKEIAKKVWEHAKPLGKQAAQKLGQGARAALTWADENLTLVISEDGELVATGALDVILTVAVVVLIVVSLGAIIYELKFEHDLDEIDDERKRRTDDLASWYMMALKGQPLQSVLEWDQTAAYNEGKKRREALVAQNGDGFDQWLRDNETDVVLETKKQFRTVISDALWAGWADDHRFAKDKWLGWVTLYGGGTDPKGLKKMDLFNKYGKDAWQSPKGWETGEWTMSGVHQYFVASTD